MTGSYREHSPAPDLAALVACTWERREAPAAAAEVRVLPDGCIDVVWSSSRGLVIAGPDTGPVVYSVAGEYAAAGASSRASRAAYSGCLPPSSATCASRCPRSGGATPPASRSA